MSAEVDKVSDENPRFFSDFRDWRRILTMVAHFVCALYTGFIIYTAQPGSSKSKHLAFVGDNISLFDIYSYICSLNLLSGWSS